MTFEAGPPRFKGCPPICEEANLPSFQTRQEAEAFHERNGPGNYIIKLGVCRFCGCWHYAIKPRPPSGDSSGISRR